MIRPLRIYLASSWRNECQPSAVSALRGRGFQVYDFRNPAEGVAGFSWSEVDPGWREWGSLEFIRGLDHPAARRGFYRDYDAMVWADVCLLLLPCGRPAHIEAGWFAGHDDKRLVIAHMDGEESELMYGLADYVCDGFGGALQTLAQIQKGAS